MASTGFRAGSTCAPAWTALLLGCLLSLVAVAGEKPAKRAGPDWWALQPVVRHDAPAVKRADWARDDVDRFILAKLESAGLSPAPEADRRALIRRVTFDLIGLPPTPEEVDAFVHDDSSDAYERLVDRLLASPHYGERWARHWLDVIRYGESMGFERNFSRPNAWRYRDWLIQSLNEDLPYDQFVRLQLAGDVLDGQNPLAIIATGYLVAGPFDKVGLELGTEAMKEATFQDYYEELTANVAQTFLGLTVNCARCHDHKFDPIAQREYYGFMANLAGVWQGDRQTPAGEDAKHRRALLQEAAKETRQKMAAIDDEIRQRQGEAELRRAEDSVIEARKRLEERQKKFDEAKEKPKDQREKLEKEAKEANEELARRERVEQIKSDVKAAADDDAVAAEVPVERLAAYRALVLKASSIEMRAKLLEPGPAHAVESRGAPKVKWLERGDPKQKRDDVAPAGLTVVSAVAADFGLKPDAPETERRKTLANWITDPKNPLPARVIVNRVWQYHFGTGLVATPNDFGFNGDRPSHPELLDRLAADFVADGWSLKKLHRRLVLSATYRQSSHSDAVALTKDAGNRLLWRYSPSRLDAEAIRDSILTIAGRMNPRMGGASFQEVREEGAENRYYTPIDVTGPAVERRSIYRAWYRSGGDRLLDVMDCPDPSVATPRRSETTTPLQALTMLNGKFTQRMADALAARLKREAGEERAKRVELLYRLAYQRPATEEEVRMALAFAEQSGMNELCLLVLNSNEFVYLE